MTNLVSFFFVAKYYSVYLIVYKMIFKFQLTGNMVILDIIIPILK